MPLTECPSLGNVSARAIPTAVFQKDASSPLNRACQADHRRTPTATTIRPTTSALPVSRVTRDVGAGEGAGRGTTAA